MDAKSRKRAALDALRNVAALCGVAHARRRRDLSLADVEELHARIVAAADASQRRQADDALAQFKGSGGVQLPLLTVPAAGAARQGTMPAARAAPRLGEDAVDAVGGEGGVASMVPVENAPFRLRCGSCLFT